VRSLRAELARGSLRGEAPRGEAPDGHLLCALVMDPVAC